VSPADDKGETDSHTTFPPTLLAGYHAFKEGHFALEQGRYRQLAETGQKPATLVIACCDSRAAPETIFNTGPGDIFVVRVVANLVPSCKQDGRGHATSAALEFAVLGLEVEHVVVLGHSRCGGIKAALDPAFKPLSPDDLIGSWIEPLGPLAEAIAGESELTDAERQTALEWLSIRHSLTNLRSFPWVDIAEKEGRLSLHGAWFDIADGDLWLMNSQTEDFARAV